MKPSSWFRSTLCLGLLFTQVAAFAQIEMAQSTEPRRDPGGVVLAGTVGNTIPHEEEGIIHVPAHDLPLSSLLSAQARSELLQEFARTDFEAPACPSMESAAVDQMPGIRRCQAEAFYKTQSYKRMRDLYAVVLTPRTIAGVYTEIFMPTDGIASRNHDRVLINLHSGGFTGGSRLTSHLESVPISAVGRIEVISIDYRMAPEYTFPAASEDVAAVYRELLKTYKPKNIGIYGCSAGATLTAQSIAWMQKEGLPLPGAVGMFCGGAVFESEGDTSHFMGDSYMPFRNNLYLKNADPNDPLVFPGRSPEVMAKFPPSLLVSSTRDFQLSPAVYTHSLLVEQGVDAELHVWEGLFHGFINDPDLPQSREFYEVVAKFFDSHLGR